jgi:VIT1/CCC1 family predicted Fe2+/Mn2+ transporter
MAEADHGDESKEIPPKRAARRSQNAGPDIPLNVISARDIEKIMKAVRAGDPPRESKAEIDSRMRIAESQNEHRQRSELFVLAIVGMTSVACIILMFKTESDSLKATCLTTLVGIITGIVGTLVGKASSKN